MYINLFTGTTYVISYPVEVPRLRNTIVNDRFECEFCGKLYKHARSLKRHKDMEHEDLEIII